MIKLSLVKKSEKLENNVQKLVFYTNERKSGANIMNPYIVFNAFVFEEQ